MDIIGAAALIAVGIVFAALVYGRTHGARPVIAGGDGVTVAPVAPVELDRPERTPDLGNGSRLGLIRKSARAATP